MILEEKTPEIKKITKILNGKRRVTFLHVAFAKGIAT